MTTCRNNDMFILIGLPYANDALHIQSLAQRR